MKRNIRTQIRQRLDELGIAIVGGFPVSLVAVMQGEDMMIVIRGDKLNLGTVQKFSHTIIMVKNPAKPLEELYPINEQESP